MRELAAMIQVSVIGYAVGGAFLELAKFDLYIMLIAIAIMMLSQLKNRLEEEGVAAKKMKTRKVNQAVGQSSEVLVRNSF